MSKNLEKVFYHLFEEQDVNLEKVFQVLGIPDTNEDDFSDNDIGDNGKFFIYHSFKYLQV